jgi:FkbM family methyltransferase
MTTNNPSTSKLEQLSRIFTLTQMPANLRVSEWVGRIFLKRMPPGLARRLKFWLLGTRFISCQGRFAYQHKDGVRNINFNGRNLQFHAIYDECYRHGYELETGLLLMRLCRGGGAFYDIGANWGYFSLLLAASNKFNGPIFAFEPNPRTYADLQNVIQQAGVMKQVQPCQIGLGSRSCTMSLTEKDSLQTGFAKLTSTEAGGQITVKRIDDLDFALPQVIKIDAEDMEADILAGGLGVLTKAQPYILFENFLDHANPDRTFGALEFLLNHGYCLFAPVLIFKVKNKDVIMTYGVNPEPLISEDADPKIGLFEVNLTNRYLLTPQLNVLAVPQAKLSELWEIGFVNLNKTPGT